MWKSIESAPTKPAVGSRGEMILGCDQRGKISRTFYANDHPRGDGWLITEDDSLMIWEPTLWCELPEKFRDRNGRSYAARLTLGEA